MTYPARTISLLCMLLFLWQPLAAQFTLKKSEYDAMQRKIKKLDSLQIELDGLKTEVGLQENLLGKCQETLRDQKAALEKAEQDLVEANQNLNDEKAKVESEKALRKKIETKDQEIARLEKERKSLEQKVKKLRKENGIQKRAIANLQSDTTDLNQDIIGLKRGLKAKDGELAIARTANQNLRDMAGQMLKELKVEVHTLATQDKSFADDQQRKESLEERIKILESLNLGQAQRVQLRQIKDELQLYLKANHAINEARRILNKKYNPDAPRIILLMETTFPANPHFEGIKKWIIDDINNYETKYTSVQSFMEDFHKLVNDQLPGRIDRFIETQNKFRPAGHPWTWETSYPYLAGLMKEFKRRAKIAILKERSLIQIPGNSSSQ